MMFLFPVYFLAATSVWFSHLAGVILNNHIAYGVNNAVEHGALEVFGLAIASVTLSSITGGGFDPDDIPCLPGPLSEDEEMDVAPTDLFGVTFATWEDSASNTPATLGNGRRGAIEQKVSRSGFQIGKALPPTALAHGLPNAARRPTREASPTKPVSTDGGSRKGMANEHDVQQSEADGFRTLDETDDWEPIVRDADLLLKEEDKLDEQVSSRLDFTGAKSLHKAQVSSKAPSSQGPPDVLEGDSAFDTTAPPEDKAYPIAAGTTGFLFVIDDTNQSGYYIGGYAPASSKTSQAPSRADAGVLVLWVPPELVSAPDEALPPAEPGALVLWVPPELVSAPDEACLPAEPGAMVLWVSPEQVSTADEDLPPAEPGAMVVWTARDRDYSPMYGTIVASYLCCHRLLRVLNHNHSGEWLMNGAILAARHASRAASALHASLAIADTSVDPSHESVLETRPSWREPDYVKALYEALAPWLYVAMRLLVACGWVWWRSHHPNTRKPVAALRWVLFWFLATSPQAFDMIFTAEAWRAIVFVGKLSGCLTWLSVLYVANKCLRVLLLAKTSAINTWLAAVFTLKLAGSVGLAILESDLVIAVLFLQAAAISIWILATHDAEQGAEQQQGDTSSTPSQTMSGPINTHEAVAAVPTVAEQRAHRKAKARERHEGGIGSHIC